jgi:hypothetical protein
MTAMKRGPPAGGARRETAKPADLPERDGAGAEFPPPAVIPRGTAHPGEFACDERANDGQTILRIEQLTTETGWLLITAGMVGVVVPGVVGLPFLLAGAVVVTPGGTKLLARWAGDNPPRIVRGAMKQIGRFLDDLERRYPRQPKSTP